MEIKWCRMIRLKTVVCSGVLCSLLWISLLWFSSGGFSPLVTCFVKGKVYLESNGDGIFNLSFDRADICSTIKHRQLENKIELWDKDYWVVVTIPHDIKGHTPIWYRWGSPTAYVDGKYIHIEWGYVVGG